MGGARHHQNNRNGPPLAPHTRQQVKPAIRQRTRRHGNMQATARPRPRRLARAFTRRTPLSRGRDSADSSTKDPTTNKPTMRRLTQPCTNQTAAAATTRPQTDHTQAGQHPTGQACKGQASHGLATTCCATPADRHTHKHNRTPQLYHHEPHQPPLTNYTTVHLDKPRCD